jgi:hypothetical protein
MVPLHHGLSDALDGWLLLEATGISDDGTVIVGYGISPNSGFDSYEAWIAVVPEPNGLILGGIGLAILVLWHWGCVSVIFVGKVSRGEAGGPEGVSAGQVAETHGPHAF